MRHYAVKKTIYKFFAFYKELRFTFFYFCRLPFASYGSVQCYDGQDSSSGACLSQPIKPDRKSGTENAWVKLLTGRCVQDA